jgi:23S rRNA (cytidine1920-2'-O)/16S rRNA (cytidine1409-2'-O)-methyltransferase
MERVARIRIDRLLVERGLLDSREKAQRSILAGEVLVDERVVDKPGTLVRADAPIRVTGAEKYVGRGGYKLEAALDHFGIDPCGWHCLDVGASTGGFTDCLLQRGAAEVWTVDVGRNQLAWKIRSDPRVKVFEGINARFLELRLPPVSADLAVADLSFISLTLVLGSIFACVRSDAPVLVLIKPQFELDPARVGKGGIVRDPRDHESAVARVCDFAVEQLGRTWDGVISSPIRGAKGNQEFLACLH